MYAVWVGCTLAFFSFCFLREKVGLNCTEGEDCEDPAVCPADSILDAITGKCTCVPERCSAPRRCLYKTVKVLTHNATKTPGDCCNVYECVEPEEVNCTGVVCQEEVIDCPPDSSPLPRRKIEGQCCSVAQGCECLPGPCPVPSPCPSGQTHKVQKPASVKPGACCPVFQCQEQSSESENETKCVHEGVEKAEGDKWNKNECTECTCIGGHVHCTSNACTNPSIKIDSDTVEFKPGGCRTSKGVIYENGATWEEDMCTTCECVGGESKCQAAMCQQYEEECKLQCESGYYKDGSGTTLCKCLKKPEPDCPLIADCKKKCRHGFKTDKAGCPACKCAHCKPIDNCTKRCPHGLLTNENGCPMCNCRPSPASGGIVNGTNECLQDEGEWKDDGEAWSDGCTPCYCYGGKEMCALIACPKIDCPDAVISKTSCCPFCPGNATKITHEHLACYGKNTVRLEGEKWTEGCLECICHGGRVMCYKEPCPPALCSHPIPGKCCPVCPEEMSLPPSNTQGCGIDRPPGSTWRQDNCVSCVCINGIAECYTEVCNNIDLTCKQPLKVKNQCCPVCLENLEERDVCQVGNVTFNVGDEWRPNDCIRCICGPRHTISCTQTICNNQCSKERNSCCPPCSETEGHKSVLLLLSFFFLVAVTTLLAGLAGAWYCCQRRHHRLRICQAIPTNYQQYKIVPATYDISSSTPSEKSPV